MVEPSPMPYASRTNGYKEERIGQGRENAKQYMADHPEMMAEVSKLVRDAHLSCSVSVVLLLNESYSLVIYSSKGNSS
jgi:hypothetical protein